MAGRMGGKQMTQRNNFVYMLDIKVRSNGSGLLGDKWNGLKIFDLNIPNPPQRTWLYNTEECHLH